MLSGLDLFTGAGGLTVALQPWVAPQAYCEIDRYAQALLLSRMSSGAIPLAPIWDDIRTLGANNLGKSDIIYGGFPCQDVSDAGPRTSVEGKRTGLVGELLRLVEELTPAFVFLENVPGIRRRGADAVTKRLASLRYDCRWTLVSAEEVGAPHRRNRWFLLAAHPDSLAVWDWRKRGAQGHSKAGDLSFDHGPDFSLAHSNGKRRSKGRTWPEVWRRLPNALQSLDCDWPEEIPQPAVCRVPDGIPFELDFLSRLGSDMVPEPKKESLSEKKLGSKSDSKASLTLWQVLRVVWESRELAKASPELYSKRLRNLVPNMSQKPSRKRGNMGQWIEEDKKLRDLWKVFYATPLEEAQNVQSKLLKYLGAKERNEAMAPSFRIESLKALGNAVVPLQAREAFKRLSGLPHLPV